MLPEITAGAAERFVGDYRIESGITPEDVAYRGRMHLDRRGLFLHAESLLEPGGVRFGLAMPFAGRLVMAFGPKDKVEIGAYRIEGDRMHGLWVPPGAAGDDLSACGQEESVGGDEGVWKITRAFAIDQAAYTGTVTLQTHVDDTAPPAPGAPTFVRIIWDLHDGQYRSFGLAFADALYTTFNFEAGTPHGIAVYEADGDVLRGTWVTDAGAQRGTESIVRE